MKPEARSDDKPAGSMVFMVGDDDAMRESLRSLIRDSGKDSGQKSRNWA
jgi:FixJ family two-component response regulator